MKELRPAYGFDDVSLVPGATTIDPSEVSISWKIAHLEFSLPVLASAMDSVVSPQFAIAMGKLGGLAILNLEGLYTRYEQPEEAVRRIVEAPQAEVTVALQEIYKEPVKEQLIARCIETIREAGVVAAVASTPGKASGYANVAVEAGADLFVVQSQVSSARHISRSANVLSLLDFVKTMPIPVLVGNCVSLRAAAELVEMGIAGILVGVGPGAACTTREVLGVGVPQVTATLDVSQARDAYFSKSGRYVPVITDGGMRTGGDISKAVASGADAVMLGSPFASCAEAPAKGYHWGMATPDINLPRGTRIKVGIRTNLEQLLLGPASVNDGTQNLAGALKQAMAVCGAKNIVEMHSAEMVVAPAVKTEGKLWQLNRSF